MNILMSQQVASQQTPLPLRSTPIAHELGQRPNLSHKTKPFHCLLTSYWGGCVLAYYVARGQGMAARAIVPSGQVHEAWEQHEVHFNPIGLD